MHTPAAIRHFAGTVSGCDESKRKKHLKRHLRSKPKALYEKLPVAFAMMAEILTESKLTDEKRLLEILEMLKSRLLMRFQSAGHTTAVLRAMGLCVSVGQIKKT